MFLGSGVPSSVKRVNCCFSPKKTHFILCECQVHASPDFVILQYNDINIKKIRKDGSEKEEMKRQRLENKN